MEVAASAGAVSNSGTSADDGAIASDSPYTYSITDNNPTQAGSQIAMDANGSLSLQHNGGTYVY